MKEITQFAGHVVEIWRRPRQRNMNLRVRPDGHLRVTCGKRVPELEIFRFISDSKNFIDKSLAHYAKVQANHPAKKYADGESFLYLGQRLPLQMVWSWNKRIRVATFPANIEMVAPLVSTSEERQLALHKFLLGQAKQIFPERLNHFARVMNLRPTSLAIRGQKTRWGSCSSKGQINLNWKLMAAPPEVIDYVIVHELAHLQHMNHSPKFWAVVERFFPEYRTVKKWLTVHEPEIAVQFQKISKAQTA